MSCVLAIDQGTSGTKAIVVDDAGTVLAIEEIELHPAISGRGRRAGAAGAAGVCSRCGPACRCALRSAVAAVALANQGETVLVWDRATGRPLSQAVVWQDRRAEAICQALVAR